MSDRLESSKQRDGATLSPRLHEIGLPLGKSNDEIARRYKHAAGKSSTYSPEVVDMIYHMAREGAMSEESVGQFVAAKLQAERDAQKIPEAATWDALVFLSANLTRLVIDPYRERCDSRVEIGSMRPKPLRLEGPVIFGGVDYSRIPETLFHGVMAASESIQSAIVVEPAILPRAIVDLGMGATRTHCRNPSLRSSMIEIVAKIDVNRRIITIVPGKKYSM